MLSPDCASTVVCHRLNYCQYKHIFAKDTNVWTTVSAWTPKGLSGNGLCRAATDYCRKNKRPPTGKVSEETGNWNHIWVIGGAASKAVKGPTKDELQNRVPALLLKEILQALPR